MSERTRHKFVATRRLSAEPWIKSQSARLLPPRTDIDTTAEGIERKTKVRRLRNDFSTVEGKTEVVEAVEASVEVAVGIEMARG